VHRRDQFASTHPIPLKAFSHDGKRLLILTTNQTASVLEVST